MISRDPSVPLEEDELVAEVTANGIPDAADARAAIRATLNVLGQRLTDDESRHLGRCLSTDLARYLDACEYAGDFDDDAFYARVQRREHTRAAIAREDADVVLRALAEAVGEDTRRLMRRALPAHVAERFALPIEPPPPAS